MKQLITLLTLLQLAHTSSAQKIGFTDTSNVWYYSFSHTTSHGVFLKKYHGDSIYRGNTYKVLGTLLVREDTATKQVFAVDRDATEKLLYDFTLETGDTFFYKFNTNVHKHIVYKIDSVEIDSTWYKVRYYQGDATQGQAGFAYAVIDNIGCMNGISFPFWTYSTVEYFERIHCFFNDGNKPVLSAPLQHANSAFSFDNTDSCYVSVSEVSNKFPKQPVIYPHPAGPGSKLLLPDNIINGELVIYNSIGQAILQKAVHRQREIPIGNMPAAGMYYYIVTGSGDAVICRGKFIYR